MFVVTFFITFAAVVFMCEVLPGLLRGLDNLSQGKSWAGRPPRIGG